MVIVRCDTQYRHWQPLARQLLAAGIEPQRITWHDDSSQAPLFDEPLQALPVAAHGQSATRVPPALPGLLQQAACFRTPARWGLLYKVLWRVAHGERQAMLAGDIDGTLLQQRVKAVRREIHHLHAFLRFRAEHGDPALDYVAWFEPQHDILQPASELFSQRLGRQRWLIATPNDGIRHDGEQSDYRCPCPRQWQHLARQASDPVEQLWGRYYSSTFNPSRLNPKVMQGHMPQRFWKHLPEAPLLPGLISDARLGGSRNGQADPLKGQPGKRIVKRS